MKEIKLTRGLTAQVDDEDYDGLVIHKWCANKIGRSFYAVRRDKGKKGTGTILMHRQIMGHPLGLLIDHKDGDGLNNQRGNLRPCTQRENVSGQKKQVGRSSQYKGVCWDKTAKKWMAYTKYLQKFKYLGHFGEEKSAARAYDDAAKQYFGEFARPNF